MAKRTNMDKVMERYGPVLKKFGDEVGMVAKKGEKSVVMMSKVLKLQLDILGGTLQKERLYHDIGKEVASRLMKGSLEIEGFEKYKKQLLKLKTEGERKKKAISKVRGPSRKKKTRKTKS